MFFCLLEREFKTQVSGTSCIMKKDNSDLWRAKGRKKTKPVKIN